MDQKDGRLDKNSLITSLELINKKLDEGISQLNLLLMRINSTNEQ